MSENTISAAPDAATLADLEKAVQALRQPGLSPNEIEAAILDLIATFAKPNRQTLIDELAALPLEMFASLKIIRAVLALAERGKRTDEMIRKFEGFHRAGGPIPLWNHEDRLKSFKNKFDYDVVDVLSSIKYAQSPARFESLEAAAEFYGPRFELPVAIIETLYENTADRSLDRASYAVKIKQGFVVEHILNDLCRRRGDSDALPSLPFDYKSLWTDDWLTDPTRMVDGKRKPAVFLTCHNGTMDHVKVWHKTVFEDGVRMGNGVSDKIVSSRDNPNAALLSAYRAAMEGNPLLIAADSPQGAAKNLLSVFGRQVSVADGFVFLSYESRADVFWTIVVPENGRLVLKTVLGPSREDGEALKAYRPRLLQFVSEQLEAYLAGPPGQIGLRKKWIDILSAPAPAPAGATVTGPTTPAQIAR